MRILLTEDDSLIAEGVSAGLSVQGFTVSHVTTASATESALAAAEFDLLILDLGLPDQDGLMLLRRLRSRNFHIPVLVLTARDSINDRVAGLQSGADDYLLKPFDLRELVARLHTLHRRFLGRSSNVIQHGELSVNPSTREFLVNGDPVDLSKKEQAVLCALLNTKGIVSVDALKDAVYGFSVDVESNALNVHIHNLRKKLGASIVQTVRGIGYRLGHLGERES
ncbi:response regulator [Ectopseudomonas khazarica]|uniref:response regulator n=1 Tax=Ectopseudomonas khazarica TaxID=2502979 RepID=UPI00106EF9EC|nr:response regulator [Pseudomonas khazarica]